ncbi:PLASMODESMATA CALLOSE-BINDING PROTEIN 5 [Bienertia sinuspersici]
MSFIFLGISTVTSAAAHCLSQIPLLKITTFSLFNLIESFPKAQALYITKMANLYNFSFIFSLLLAVTWKPIKAEKEKAVIQQQQLWCVAKNNAEDSALQQALDWACGPGGANCRPIQNGGPCYDPNDLIDMASYAFNDYCLRHGMTEETCDFSNNAALTALDPSHDKCRYPSSSLTATNATTPSTAGIIPGSENMNGNAKSAAIEVWMLAFMNLLFAVSILSL